MQIEGVSISLKRIRRRALYAYQGIECILPLRGQLTVEWNGCSFLLETDHVLVLNNGELHAFSGDENHDILFLQISDGFLLRSCEELLTHPITCCSANDKEQERYYQIKRILTQMLFLAMKEEKRSFSPCCSACSTSCGGITAPLRQKPPACFLRFPEYRSWKMCCFTSTTTTRSG